MLNLAGDLDDSLCNGEGMRYVIYSQGCEHRCEGCHNKHTWSLDKNFEISVDDMFERIMDKPLIEGVTFSGGEPFLQAKDFAALAKRIKEETKLNIWCYTGYLYEDLLSSTSIYVKELLNNIDVLVDGKFEIDNQEGALKWTGSANQKIYFLTKPTK